MTATADMFQVFDLMGGVVPETASQELSNAAMTVINKFPGMDQMAAATRQALSGSNLTDAAMQVADNSTQVQNTPDALGGADLSRGV